MEKEKDTKVGGDHENAFDLQALGVLGKILERRAARKASTTGRVGEEGDEPLSPWSDEDWQPPKGKAPPKRHPKPPAGKRDMEHSMDRYARDGRRRRLP
jgi:hypothetical protein